MARQEPGEKNGAMATARAFRIVVASHGDLAHAMLGSAAMICGPIADAVAVDLQPDQSPEDYDGALRSAMGDDGRPVLILTDLLGGTPHNVATFICCESRGTSLSMACVSGTNLGMLLEAATSMKSLDAESVRGLEAAGRASIVDFMRHLEESRS
jgi:mannose/fructose-specific phosphotransferase system component IIA